MIYTFLNLFVRFLGWADVFGYYLENTLYKTTKLIILALLIGNIYLYFPIIMGASDLETLRDTYEDFYVSNFNASFYDPTSYGNSVLGVTDVRRGLQKTNSQPIPSLSAKAVLVVDLDSESVLYSINQDTKLPPASTTKIMTALISEGYYNSLDVLEMQPECSDLDTQNLGLAVGESFYYQDLINALLVYSGGDAACVLSTSRTTLDIFIESMNRKAAALNMKNTHFVNAIGLDGENGSQYSTAWDLYLLFKEFKKYPQLNEIVSEKSSDFSPVNDRKKVYTYLNTNKLLWEIPGTRGVKTGKTVAAKEVLLYEYSKDGYNLFIAVLGSEDRFGDTKELLKWVLTNYSPTD